MDVVQTKQLAFRDTLAVGRRRLGRSGGNAFRTGAILLGLLSSLQFASSAYGSPGAAAAQRPLVGELNVPGPATAGRPPRVSLRIDEAGVRTVNLGVTVNEVS